MAIKDIITDIKTYFCEWHKKHYSELHTDPTNTITNQEPESTKAATSKAVYNYVNNAVTYPNLLAKNVKDATRNQTVQTTLDQFYTDLNNKITYNDIPFASTGTITWRGQPRDIGYKPTIPTHQDGLMTWQDKAVLKGLSIWDEGHEGPISYYINPVLRLVFLHYSEKNSTVLKTEKYVTKNLPTVLANNYKPVGGVSVATGVPGTVMHVHSDGYLVFKANQSWGHTENLVANIIWYYRGKDMYNNINSEAST